MIAHPESLDGKPPPKHYRWWRFVERRLPIIVIYLMVVTLIGFVIAPSIMVTVPSGHVGLLWKRFRGGTQLDALYPDDENYFTWWAPWRNLRQRNIGWRLDYVLASKAIAQKAIACPSYREIGTSDHAPVVATFR